MSYIRPFPMLVVRDFVVLGVAGGITGGIIFGEETGFSFAAACIWLALNFTALAWLLAAVASGRRTSRLFIFILACAKIPASYFILFWLYRVEYLKPAGLTVGLAILPVVILLRGLMWRPTLGANEEG